MKKRLLIPLALILLLALILAACLRLGAEQSGIAVPESGDGWAAASLAEVGLDEEPLLALLERLDQGQGENLNSLLIVKDGLLVLEQYYPGQDIAIDEGLTFTWKQFDSATPHCQASVSKSVTSLLFGIARDQGLIPSLDESVFESFPEYADLSGGGKSQLTLRQTLTMTAGFPWDEDTYPYTDDRNDLVQMYFSPDPIRNMLEKPLIQDPGEAFLYDSGLTNLLGEIVRRKTGTALADFGEENLFAPLGISGFQWLAFPADPEMAVASSLLYLRPRDMAKIGQLMLNGGSWNGRQIISADWVESSTSPAVPLSQELSPVFQETGYGYQWWQGMFKNGGTEVIFAGGWGGQFIFILPQQEMVIVLTGSNYNGNYVNVLDIVNRYVLGAVYGTDWENPDYGVVLNIPVDSGIVIEVRSGPGDSYPVVGELERGREVKIIGWNGMLEVDQSWLQLSPAEWVALKDLLGREERILTGNLAGLPVISGP